MLEHLGIICAKERTGASIYMDKNSQRQRIFAGQIGDVVVKDEKKGVYCIAADEWEQLKPKEKSKKTTEANPLGEQNV